MTSPRDIIEAARHDRFVDDQGRPATLNVVPGAADEDVDWDLLSEALGGPLPPPLAELLRHTRGIGFGLVVDGILFNGPVVRELAGLVPLAMVLVDNDGAGNMTALVLDPVTHAPGPVLFLSHDPPVLFVEGADLSDYLGRWLDAHRPGSKARTGLDSPSLFHAWEGRLPTRGALKGRAPTGGAYRDPVDVQLARFLDELGDLPDADALEVADLRHPPAGAGFSWALRATIARRDPTHLLFALRRRRTLAQRLGALLGRKDP